VHHQAEKVIFRTFYWTGEMCRVRVVDLAVLASVLRATTEKVVNFLEKKSAPPEKNPDYAYVSLEFPINYEKRYETHYVVKQKYTVLTAVSQMPWKLDRRVMPCKRAVSLP